MNIKKQLKKQVEESERKLLEQDTDFRDCFKAEYCNGSASAKKKKIFASVSAAVACALCAVLLMLFLPNIGLLKRESEKEYFDSNAVEVNSDIANVNSYLDGIVLKNTEKFDYKAIRVYDKKYNEILYFKIKNNKLMAFDISIYFYVNKDYKDRNELSSGTLKTVNGIEYLVQDKSTAFDYIYKAQFTCNDITTYIEYQQSTAEPDGFIEFLEQTFLPS